MYKALGSISSATRITTTKQNKKERKKEKKYG
jgi:hypothetical protein